MDTVKVKRISKKVAKNGFWILSDVFFLALKAVGAVFLVSIVAGTVFLCFFLYYIKNNIITDLELNPSDFAMSRSSTIVYIDPLTNREAESVIIQSPEFRQWVNYEEMPEHLINAVIAIEDHRFYSHQGVDWYRTAGAFLNMFLGMRDTFGGSTITQQLIKNLTSYDDVTVARKLQEIFRALEYERQYGKEEILELYLNLVYFGHGCYGIGAAAHYYFDKDVSELTLPEAAAIVSITNNPSLYSPYADREANKERQETVLWSMRKRGYIRSEEEYKQALNAVLHFQRGTNETDEQIIYTWFEEAVMRDAVSEMVSQLGYSEQIARRRLYSGGLKIVSTINPDIQAVVDEIYNNPENLPEVTGSTQQLQSGIIIADPYSGEIVALSGGVGRKTRNLILNRATQTRRPPGSAIKPISVYALAMEMGMITPDTTFLDSADIELSGTTWWPKNVNRRYSEEPVTVRDAIRSSVNTIAATVLDHLTPSTSYYFTRDMLGIDLDPADEAYAPLSLGQLTWGATVREMTSAYTIFPNGGERLELRTFSMIYDYNGDVLLDNSTSRSISVISDVAAYWMTDMLCDVVTAGTGGSASLGEHMPVAGKTGTTSDDWDRWFVGFTPYYIASVWTGYDNPADMDSSGNPAAQIWKMVMEPIHENLPTREFNTPANIELLPVVSPWELDATEYTVRCIDVEGNILDEYIEESTIGAEVTVDAPEIAGYELIGQPFDALQVTADVSRNVIVFVYQNEWQKNSSGSGSSSSSGGGDNNWYGGGGYIPPSGGGGGGSGGGGGDPPAPPPPPEPPPPEGDTDADGDGDADTDSGGDGDT